MMPNERLSPPDPLKERTLAAARSTYSPLRGELRLRNAAVMAFGLLIMGGIFVAVGAVRPSGRPASLMIETAVGGALIAAAGLWVVLGRNHRVMGPARSVLLAVSLASPLAFLLWKVAWNSAYDGMMEPWPARPGYRCLMLTIVLAIGPLLAVVFLRRHSVAVHPAAQGVALGVVFGMCAAVLGDLWCPVGHIPHLLGGHILPVGLLALAGAWPLASFLAIRRS